MFRDLAVAERMRVRVTCDNGGMYGSLAWPSRHPASTIALNHRQGEVARTTLLRESKSFSQLFVCACEAHSLPPRTRAGRCQRTDNDHQGHCRVRHHHHRNHCRCQPHSWKQRTGTCHLLCTRVCLQVFGVERMCLSRANFNHAATPFRPDPAGVAAARLSLAA